MNWIERATEAIGNRFMCKACECQEIRQIIEAEFAKCPSCDGSGFYEGYSNPEEYIAVPCEECSGTGKRHSGMPF